MNKAQQTVIFYHGGSYGTYVRWLIESLFSNIEIELPFTTSGPNIGNSHAYNYESSLHEFFQTPEELLQNIDQCNCNFVFNHPKTQQTHSVQHIVDLITKKGCNCIFLYPDLDYKCLAVNNWYQKTRDNWWSWQAQDNKVHEKIYKHWPVSEGTAIESIPNWIKREFLSLYLLPSWEDQVEWYFPDRCTNRNCQFISFSDLFYNPKEVVNLLQKLSGLQLYKDFDQIAEFHDRMLSLQKNIGQDKIFNQIINSFEHDSYLQWSPDDLTIVTESMIQHHLRKNGIELKCNELNYFPTNTNDLKQLCF